MITSLRLGITNIVDLEDDFLTEVKTLFEVSQTSETELVLKMKETMRSNMVQGNLIVSDVSKKLATALKGSIDDEILDLGISTDFNVIVNTVIDADNDAVITATINNLLDSSKLNILTVSVENSASPAIQSMYDVIIEKCKAASYINSVEELTSTKIK